MIIRAKEQGYQYCSSGNCQQNCAADFRCYQNCKGNCRQQCTTGERCYQSCSIDGNCRQMCNSSECYQRCTIGQNCNATCQATGLCEQVCFFFRFLPKETTFQGKAAQLTELLTSPGVPLETSFIASTCFLWEPDTIILKQYYNWNPAYKTGTRQDFLNKGNKVEPKIARRRKVWPPPGPFHPSLQRTRLRCSSPMQVFDLFLCPPYHELLDPGVPTRNEAKQGWIFLIQEKGAGRDGRSVFVPRRRPEKFSAWVHHSRYAICLPQNGESGWGSQNHMQISQLLVKLLTRFSSNSGRQINANFLDL